MWRCGALQLWSWACSTPRPARDLHSHARCTPSYALSPCLAAPKVTAAAAFTRARPAPRVARAAAPRQITCMASNMQFIKGIDEPTIPEVKLTRSRDGASGTGEWVGGRWVG